MFIWYISSAMEKRLQSLKLPRDLTLGGTKPKKTFTPNLNVARNKEKSKAFFMKNEDKRRINNRKDTRNNKRFIDKPERFIQSSGIFSDGMGSDALKKNRYERTYSSKEDTNSVMTVPKVKKDEWQVDNKNETRVYDDIMGCESLIDEDDKSPFNPVSWNESDLKEGKVPITLKPEVKNDSNESVNLNLNGLKIETENTPREYQESDRFSDCNPGITLWNMPDTFAGKGLSDDPNVQTFFDYKLNEMLEGQIGKMKIHKSGKVEVCIGCVRYQIEATQLETFSEKVVAIDTRDEDSTGIVLGQVQNRYILNPNWSYLLKES